MDENPAVSNDRPLTRERSRRLSMTAILSLVAGLVGVAAIGAAGWVYRETQHDMAAIATELAQMRVSLDLLGQQGETATDSGDGEDQLRELSNRLAILEEGWRGSLFAPGDAPAPATPAPAFTPPTAAAPAPGTITPTSGDCLPTGTRFMVAAGDVYPVCGTPARVEIGAVDNGFITLANGTVIAQGATVGLPASQCMIAVVPSDGGTLSGFAEIRVTC